VNKLKTIKPWGHEIRFAITEKYLGKILYIEKGQRLSRQYHVQKDETIYVLEGTLILEIGHPGSDEYNSRSTLMKKGDRWRIKPGTIHRFSAPDNMSVTLVEVSTPEIDDVIRLEDDYNRI
jgi:mannose-6-phosphate isomerase